MAEPLVTVAVRRPYPLDLHIAVPIARRGHGPGMRAEPDQGGILVEALAAELPDIQLLSHHPHVGVARVADMRVVGPDDRLGLWPPRLQQMAERLEHMRVAQIPR